jgi:hypothetical protein
MSNHFTYEINEAGLRAKLKNIAIPVNEDSWRRFESYSDANFIAPEPVSWFQNVQIGLNRNVVIPVVFGVVIIMFSLLLFNFVSIKNPSKASVSKQNIVVNPPVATVLNEKAIAIKPAAPIVEKVEPQVIATVEKQTSVVESSAKLSIESALESPVTHSARPKKSPAKTIEASVFRPDIISEDTDPEIRPN